MREKKKSVLIILLSVLILTFGGWLIKKGDKRVFEDNLDKITAVMHKSPTCGCCLGDRDYMQENGFNVQTVVEDNIESIKAKYNIPYEYQSCHTTEIDGYFVEGHVPVEAINKLLTEKPDIDGITLPGMPAGSPGMAGVKRGEFVVYALKDGKASEFMRI